MSKTVLVFGATGAQGGSVVRHLKGSNFKIRAVTRNTNSDAAQKLASEGIELAQGDISGSLDEAIFNGLHAVFLVTNFWDPSTGLKEFEQGKVVVDLAHKAGVKQFIYSSLANVQEQSNGKWDVPHFTNKAKLEKYIKEKGFQYTAFPAVPFYYQNFPTFFTPRADEQGNLSITFPQTETLTAGDISECGIVVRYLLEHPEEYNGQFIAIHGEHKNPAYYVDILSKKLGKPIACHFVPHDVFAKFGFPGAEEFAQMFGWFNDYTYFGTHDRNYGKKIHNFKSFQQWVDEQEKVY